MGVVESHQIEVRPASSQREIDQLLALRYDVFCVEQGVPEREERDGRDGEGLHLIAVVGEEVIATCRLLFSGDAVLLSRLVVAKPYRRLGVASELLRAADAIGRGREARRILLHAQTYAQELYAKDGYQPRGRVFVEANIQHIAMEKLL